MSASSSVQRSAFVTGAAGFLGRHLMDGLVRRGWRVTAFCLPGEPIDSLPPAPVARGDVTDAASLLAAMPEAVDAVSHLAGDTSTSSRDAARQYRVNVVGTTKVVQAALARSARRLIYTSSISAYGYQPGVRISEQTLSNVQTRGDNYGRSKFDAEQLIKRAATDTGLSAVILNPVNIVGPYDRSNWTQQLILPIARGLLSAVPPGSATWAYAPDVADAHIAAVDHGRPGENYLLGGVQASFKDVVNEIERLLGKPLSRHATPKVILQLALWTALAKSRIDGKEPPLTPQRYRRAVGDLRCDDDKAKRELRYTTTDLRTMLAATIEWLQEERLLNDGDAPR
ncbi:MAG: NAD-dependent epimerase/dehydratase family protein [Ilumatobacteraceae bacterium]